MLDSGLRVLLAYADAHDEAEPARCRDVHAPDIEIDEVFESYFNPIARDGCSLVEVQTRLIVVLEALALRSPDLFERPAAASAHRAAERSSLVMTDASDRTEIAHRAKWTAGLEDDSASKRR